jgi:general secretion pathway protein K
MRAPAHRAVPSGRQRGAALLVVITSIAILAAVTVDLAYNTRLSLQSAANARDELRAYWLAKSAVAMSRLVLNMQQKLDGATGGATPGAPAAPTATPTPPATAAAAPGGALASAVPGLAGLGKMSVRLWELVPIDSSAASLFLGGAGAGAPAPAAEPPAPQGEGAPAAAAEGARRAFGDAEGSFHATIDDEERKINVRQFNGIGLLTAAQTSRLAALVQDPKWDFLFDEDDANGMRVSRKDLFAAIKDWQDEDEMSSAFTGNPQTPFENGFGDENSWYDRLTDRYKAKNAWCDSLDELYMVAGVSDAFMAAFGDKLTIYPDQNAPINVNTTDPQQLMINAVLLSDPPGVPQPALMDPAFMGKLQAALALARPLPFVSITPQQFTTVLQALGLKLRAECTQANNTNCVFSDKSQTFHIAAVGVAGDVTKHIDAVVTFDPRKAEGLAQDTGRLLHWHEE